MVIQNPSYLEAGSPQQHIVLGIAHSGSAELADQGALAAAQGRGEQHRSRLSTSGGVPVFGQSGEIIGAGNKGCSRRFGHGASQIGVRQSGLLIPNVDRRPPVSSNNPNRVRQ